MANKRNRKKAAGATAHPKKMNLNAKTMKSSSERRCGEISSSKHDEAKSSAATTAANSKASTIARSSTKMPLPIKGLTNLGNTCFFNSVVQNLMQTHQLEELLFSDSSMAFGAELILKPSAPLVCYQKIDDINQQSSSESQQSSSYYQQDLDDMSSLCNGNGSFVDKRKIFTHQPLTITLNSDLGNLTKALRKIFEDFKSSLSSASILTPSHLLDQVCRKAPRFKGFQQQDSHELLRYLLDALRNEELRRLRTAVLAAFNIPVDTPCDQIPLKMRQQLRAYGKAAEVTCVERVFGGELVQCIKCKQCGHVFSKLESFLDLSLPIVDHNRSIAAVSANLHIRNCASSSQADSSNNNKNWSTAAAFSDRKSNYSIKKEKKMARKQAKSSGAAKGLRKSISDGNDQKNLNDSLSSLTIEVKVNDAEGNDDPETLKNIRNDDPVEDSGGDRKKDSSTTTQEENLPDNIAAKLEFYLNIDDDAKDSVDFGTLNDKTTTISEKSGDSEQTERYPEIKTADTTISSEKIHPGQSDSNNNNPVVNDKWDFYMTPLSTHSSGSDSHSSATPSACHVTSCLAQFMATEILDGKNKFGCEFCSKNRKNSFSFEKKRSSENFSSPEKKSSKCIVYTDALKQYLIYSPPAVLTLHLKRFHQLDGTFKKINKHVEFPLILDLAPFCSRNGKRVPLSGDKILYSLYGVVSHSGRLSGGHYVAYVKIRPKIFGDKSRQSLFLQSTCSQLNDLCSQAPAISCNLPPTVAAVDAGAEPSVNCNSPNNCVLPNNTYFVPDSNNNRGNNNNYVNGFVVSNEKIDKLINGSIDDDKNSIDSRRSSSIDNSATIVAEKIGNNVDATNEKWYYVSDSHVTECQVSKVMNSEAYLLFYERIE